MFPAKGEEVRLKKKVTCKQQSVGSNVHFVTPNPDSYIYNGHLETFLSF